VIDECSPEFKCKPIPVTIKSSLAIILKKIPETGDIPQVFDSSVLQLLFGKPTSVGEDLIVVLGVVVACNCEEFGKVDSDGQDLI